MNGATGYSDQRASPQHRSQDTPEAPNEPPRPPLKIHVNPDYYKHGPRRLASIGDNSWTSHATRERLARQCQGQDGEYRACTKNEVFAQQPETLNKR